MIIITSRNNASISKFGGGFRWKSEYPWCIIKVKSKHFPTVFKKIEKNKKKNDGKTGIFTQNQFSTESIFLYGCNLKTNHCKYLKFSPNVYVSVIYIQLNLTEIFDFYANFFFEVSFKFLRNLSKTRKFAMRLNFKFSTKSRNDNDLSSNDFKYFISRRYLKILQNLNFGVFRPLKHKPPFSPTTGNYILG
ncbi:hypothetical protein AGLY_004494 [Aphis glycines]|uniref:Uncharacterized protein n=1 Tax=Aphis glycines TaxID=307491 RepID=A0A6G0TY80_APHGL|nr:hypothetical protein AGLY_004494 [Aphis glycines]